MKLEGVVESLLLSHLEAGKGIGFIAYSLDVDAKELSDSLYSDEKLLSKCRDAVNLGQAKILNKRKNALEDSRVNSVMQYDHLMTRFISKIGKYGYARKDQDYFSDAYILSVFKTNFSMYELAYALGVSYTDLSEHLTERIHLMKELDRIGDAFKNKFV